MADMNRSFAGPVKTSKIKRPNVSSAATRKMPCASAYKDKTVSRQKVNKNATIISEIDLNRCQDNVLPNFDADTREFAYGKFLRTMLEDCLVDEKIQREETEVDIQMAQLADRFKNTMEQLDKTNRRLKDIKFVVEQKRLLDLKTADCAKFCDMTEESQVYDLVNKLSATQQSCLDKLDTRNVDFGYSKESGHKQLLDAVNEAIHGLDQIKKHSNLDPHKFDQYAKSENHLKELEKDRFDLDSLKSEFEAKFPRFSEKLLKEASEKIAMVMKSDDEYEECGEEEEDDG